MAQPIKIGLVNRPLTCEEHDSNIDALLNRSNHTGIQNCDTIEPTSLDICVAATDTVSTISQDLINAVSRIQSLEDAIQGGGTIQQDIQALRNELLNEIDQLEITLNNHDTRITDLETRADLFDSSIISINASIAFEVGQLQTQIDANANAISAIQTVNTNQSNQIFDNVSDIQQEAANRANDISTVNTNINNEIANRITADSNLQTNITTEQNNRIAADNNLQNQITTEISDRQSEDNDIRNDFAAADLNLQNQINALSSSINDVVPAGTIVMWAGAAIPAGWLLCNAQAVSRTTYANLFSAIGTQYGSTSASNFLLPSFDDRFPKALTTQTNSNQGGAVGGQNNYQMSVSQLPSHTHSVTLGSHAHPIQLEHYHLLNMRGHSHGGAGGALHSHELTIADSKLGERTNSSGEPTKLLVEDGKNADASIGLGTTFRPFTAQTDTRPVIPGTSTRTNNTNNSVPNIWPNGEPFSPGYRTDKALGNANSTLNTDLGSKTTNSTGSGTHLDNRPAFIALKFIIKT